MSDEVIVHPEGSAVDAGGCGGGERDAAPPAMSSIIRLTDLIDEYRELLFYQLGMLQELDRALVALVESFPRIPPR
jgi:hypothetical protein